MTISLKYGSQKIFFTIHNTDEVLSTKEPKLDVTKRVFQHELKKLFTKEYKNFDSIAIVISDKTRLCDYPLYLPWLVETLEKEGAKKENISFYISYGTHPKQTDTESLNSYGDVFKKYNFVHHDCNNQNLFINLGETKRGTPIFIRKDLANSSLIITFGPISYHYFAGFGGGRKLIFPGLGEKKAIYHNHSLFLNTKTKGLDPSCQPGKLEGNPVAEDLKEIDSSFPHKLSIYGILNSEGKVCKLLFGKTYADFVEVCKIYNHYYKSKTNKTYDLVITSSGGYPKDINFIQVHKSIHHASAFVKDGGTLIVLAECLDGIGNDSFLEFFKEKDPNILFRKLEHEYTGNGGTALAMKAKTKRINILMLTQLNQRVCTQLGVKQTSVTEIKSMIKKHTGSMAIIPNASMLSK